MARRQAGSHWESPRRLTNALFDFTVALRHHQTLNLIRLLDVADIDPVYNRTSLAQR